MSTPSDIFLSDGDIEISYETLISNLNTGHCDHLICSLVYDILSDKTIDLTPYKMEVQPLKKPLKSKTELLKRISSSNTHFNLRTSGTTGKRKIIGYGIPNLLQDTKKTDSKHIWMLTYNPVHMGGIQVLLQALINGNTIIYAYKKDRLTVFKEIRKHRVTHIAGTPTFFRLLTPPDQQFDTVIRASTGGERLDTKTIKIISAIFPKAITTNIYALTEAGSVLYSKNNHFELNSRCKIINDILFVKTKDGTWCDTGDTVQLVSETKFKFTGRRKNIINIAGNDVNTAEIEDALKNHKAISNAIVYHRETTAHGNVLLADVVKSEFSLTETNIKQFLADESFSEYQIPRIINFKKALNVSDNQKTVK